MSAKSGWVLPMTAKSDQEHPVTPLGAADIDSLPAALNAHQAAALTGVGVDHVWQLAREGGWPTPVLKLGRTYRFPTRPLLEALGLVGPTESEERAPLRLVDVGELAEPPSPAVPRGP